MGSKKSSSTSTTSSNLYDQRSITSIDDRDTSYTSTLNWDLSDRSTTNSSYNLDSSNRSTSSYALDSSNRSSTTIYNADAAAIAKANAELLEDFSADQTDAVRAIAQMQASGVNAIGGAFTDVASLASANTTRAWTHTIDAGADLLGRVVDATKQSSDSARLVAQAAIASYQPAESKNADALKYGAIAAAAALAFVVLNKG